MVKMIIPTAIAGIVIVAIIMGLVMMNTHPSLAEIVENKDCQELGKFDQRMDETYGYDANKAKSELNISNELWSKATSLGVDCALGVVDSTYDDSSEANELFSEWKAKKNANEKMKHEVIEIVQKRDCRQFIEWYKVNEYNIRDFNDEFHLGEIMELMGYDKYCKDSDTVLDENGIDIEEKWSDYSKWDKK